MGLAPILHMFRQDGFRRHRVTEMHILKDALNQLSRTPLEERTYESRMRALHAAVAGHNFRVRQQPSPLLSLFERAGVDFSSLIKKAMANK